MNRGVLLGLLSLYVACVGGQTPVRRANVNQGPRRGPPLAAGGRVRATVTQPLSQARTVESREQGPRRPIPARRVSVNQGPRQPTLVPRFLPSNVGVRVATTPTPVTQATAESTTIAFRAFFGTFVPDSRKFSPAPAAPPPEAIPLPPNVAARPLLPPIISHSKEENDRIGNAGFNVNRTENGNIVTQSGNPVEFFVGEMYVVISGLYLSVVNGRVLIYGKHYVVCGYTVAFDDDYFCCVDNVYAKTLGDVQCCGSNYYHPDSELCCQGSYYKKVEPTTGLAAECCGGTFSLTQSEICCADLPYLKSEGGCCNDRAYALGTFCCVAGQLDFLNSTTCSGCVSSSRYQCCGSEQFRRKAGFICCDNKYINTKRRSCCGGEPINKRRRDCCGERKFNPKRFKCCPNKKILRIKQSCPGSGNPCRRAGHLCCDHTPHRRKAGYRCCGKKYYRRSTQSCCGKQVIGKSTTGCCRGTPFGRHTHKCCSNGENVQRSQQCPGDDPCKQPGYLCCDGTRHVIRFGHACCGKKYYSHFNTFCCGGQVSPFPKKTHKCCPNNAIVSKNEYCPVSDPCRRPGHVCCSGEPHVQQPGYKCCGTKYYGQLNHACCNGHVINNAQVGCCNQIPFNKNFLKCCPNKVIKQKQHSCFADRCNAVGYLCCNGRRHRRKQGFRCCGKGYINPNFQGCCGEKSYSRTSQKCCPNSGITEKYKSCTSSTCGRYSYNKSIYGCCAERTYRLAFQKCCSNGRIVLFHRTCPSGGYGG